MLYSVNQNRYVKHIPHLADYKIWISRLSSDELDAIQEELNQRIGENDIHTSSWMPGTDWTGTVFQPIYEKACLRNVEVAGMCFGIILWEVIKDRDDVWGFDRYEKNGIPIEGRTYFLIHNPPRERNSRDQTRSNRPVV